MSHKNSGEYDRHELEELNNVTAYGGTTPSSWTCGTFLTMTICPTSGCTPQCPR